jgi:hypothetical protein
MGAFFNLTHLVNTSNERTICQVQDKHVTHARIKILPEIICLCFHTFKNKYGAALRVAMASNAMPPGSFECPTLLPQWGYFYDMADTKIAAQRRPSSYRIGI